MGPFPKMAAKICYAGFVWAFLGIQFTIVAMNLFRLVLVFKVIRYKKKSGIRETLNLLMCADISTDSKIIPLTGDTESFD